MKDLSRLQGGVIATTWITNLRAAAPQYRAGIDAVQVNPMELAANAEAYWAQRVAEAARLQKFSTALQRVSFADWKTAAKTTGGDRLANLPDLKKRKQLAFWQRFLPILVSVTNQTRQMPKQTYEQRKARANAQMDMLHSAAAGAGNV